MLFIDGVLGTKIKIKFIKPILKILELIWQLMRHPHT